MLPIQQSPPSLSQDSVRHSGDIRDPFPSTSTWRLPSIEKLQPFQCISLGRRSCMAITRITIPRSRCRGLHVSAGTLTGNFECRRNIEGFSCRSNWEPWWTWVRQLSLLWRQSQTLRQHKPAHGRPCYAQGLNPDRRS